MTCNPRVHFLSSFIGRKMWRTDLRTQRVKEKVGWTERAHWYTHTTTRKMASGKRSGGTSQGAQLGALGWPRAGGRLKRHLKLRFGAKNVSITKEVKACRHNTAIGVYSPNQVVWESCFQYSWVANGIPVNDGDYEEVIQSSRGKEKKIKNIYSTTRLA